MSESRHTVAECARCECRDIRVLWTYRAADGSIRRRRCCRHCSHAWTTIERELRSIYEDESDRRDPRESGI